MIVPIRCYSCGKPIGQLWAEYTERVKKGEDRKKVMDELGLDRYCCRTVFLGTIELMDDIGKFKKF